MNKNEKLLADLYTTRNILADRGRCRGKLEDHEGKVCLEGAIAHAVGPSLMARLAGGGKTPSFTNLELTPRAKRLMEALEKELPSGATQGFEPIYSLYMFNDAYDTSDQDIFDLIQRTINANGGAL